MGVRVFLWIHTSLKALMGEDCMEAHRIRVIFMGYVETRSRDVMDMSYMVWTQALDIKYKELSFTKHHHHQLISINNNKQ